MGVSLGDLWGLWKWKGIAGVQQRTPGLLGDKFYVINRTDQYVAIHTDCSDVFEYVSKLELLSQQNDCNLGVCQALRTVSRIELSSTSGFYIDDCR